MKLYVTGASGLLGSAICRGAISRGDEVLALSRRARTSDGPGMRWIEGDPFAAPVEDDRWHGELAGCDAVIHLAGEPIGDRRWTEGRKAKIRDSRIEGTRRLVAALGRLAPAERPRTLIVANGIDYYPFDESDTAHDEAAAAGTGFLAELCVAWQAEADAATAHGVSVVAMRTGIVLSAEGGAFPRLLTPFKMFVGGRIGSGRQWFSWVHIDDVVKAYLFAATEPAPSGPLNLVAPNPVRAAELARLLGAALHRPSWLPVPRFALKLATGEIAAYLAEGRRVVPAKLLAAGFHFDHPELPGALAALLKEMR